MTSHVFQVIDTVAPTSCGSDGGDAVVASSWYWMSPFSATTLLSSSTAMLEV